MTDTGTSPTTADEPDDAPDAAEPDPRLGPRYHRLFAASVISNLGDGMSTIAYPWLASAVTRNPILVAIVAVAQRLPWLVFTLPAGVITDRVDRRRAMVVMDVLRGALTVLVALAVLARQDALPGPDEVEQVAGTEWTLYTIVVLATLLLGMAEVLRDNSAQTIIPNLVRQDQFEKANGRLWSAESVTNTFVGPPLGSVLLAVAFFVPFVIDAATFFASAALLALIPGTFRADTDGVERRPWRTELAEGFGWLWHHSLLRPLAIILGLLNGAAMATMATLVLFAQEVLGVGPLLFTVIGFGGAIGGIIGGGVADRLTKRFGPGALLGLTLIGSAAVNLVIGASSWWPVVLVMFALTSVLAIVWNVITVSLRQTIIPSRLLGRVNSVYRFFGWGMMPIGAALGGVIVAVVELGASREMALRSVWFITGGFYVLLWIFGRAKLTTDKIEAAKAAAAPTTS